VKTSLNRSLAIAAGVLAIGALLVGDRPGRSVEQHTKEVSTVELAGWIKDGNPDLHIIDLRSPTEFAAFHIPGAVQLPDSGSSTASTIVVYSDKGSDDDAAQAAALLTDHTGQILVLRGGVNAWLNDIMLPKLPPDPTPEQRQRYTTLSALSHYFGGHPSALGIDTAKATTANAVGKLRRMGC
jgi:rhodanese-related sulfurtransferase